MNLNCRFHQVCSVLDSLEREYKRGDDWLARQHGSAEVDRVTLIAQVNIWRHLISFETM